MIVNLCRYLKLMLIIGKIKSIKYLHTLEFTFFLSLIEPFPLTMILQPVSCSNCFAVIPLGPRILPTKLNCKEKEKKLNMMLQDHSKCLF